MKNKERVKVATLCFPVIYDGGGSRVLLGIKANKVGKGSLNGYGGKLKRNEAPGAGALRELEEESGLRGYKNHLHLCALVHSFYRDGSNYKLKWTVYVYTLEKWRGEPRETKEILEPKWFAMHDTRMPYKKMIPGARRWLSRVFWGNKQIIARVFLSKDGKKLEGFGFDETEF